MSVTTFDALTTISFADLVRAAAMAPSPDNNQPWRFAVDGQRVFVYADTRRSLPSDVKSIFDLTALGAAIENACIAARREGHVPTVSYCVPPRKAEHAVGDLVATMTLAPGAVADPLFRYLSKRCTCRRPYAKKPIPPERLAEIEREIDDFAEVRLDWITDRPRIRAFAKWIAAADGIRLAYQPFHRELYQQLRFSTEDAERTRDGLDVRTLELPWGGMTVLWWLRRWSRMQMCLRTGGGRFLTLPSAQLVRKSGALGIVSVCQPRAEEFLQGGRAFQRVWLAATAAQLSLHPLGSLPIFLLQLHESGAQSLSCRHQRLLRDIDHRLKDAVPAVGHRTIQMVFRVGYSAAPSHQSLRRPLADILTPDSLYLNSVN